jgi:predicted  nucleic acid-binding Zn-ribbon protein
MTIEERFEFLFQSIASHDQQLGLLVESQARTDREIAELRASIKEGSERMDKGFERVERGFERVQLNLDRLSKAMLGLTEHVVDHKQRIENLEEGAAK